MVVIPRESVPSRKCFPHEWGSRLIRSFTLEQKVIWCYLTSGPQTNRIGYFRIDVPRAARELHLGQADVWLLVQQVAEALGWLVDERARIVWNMRFFRDNPPDNLSHACEIVTDLKWMPRGIYDEAFVKHVAYLKPRVASVFSRAARQIIDAEATNRRVTLSGPPVLANTTGNAQHQIVV